MRQSGEPSVEEILASIKKVIARDNSADRGWGSERIDQPDRPSRRSLAEFGDSDVLDLAKVAAKVLEPNDDESVSVTAAAHAVPDPVYASEEESDDDMADDRTRDEAPLLPEGTTSAMRDSLAALAMLAAPGVPPQIVRSGETSLEGLVRDMLRPMLSEWLDRNLPAMVEKMVAAEIARIAGKRG